MARPEYITDIDLVNIEFATIDVDKIALDPQLLKGYTAFLEAVTKAGVEIDTNYRGARFLRRPTLSEQTAQLREAQTKWDNGKKYYETLAAVGECEYSYERSLAADWAAVEGLPFPPEHDPIDAFDAVIRDIDEVTA